MSAAGSAHRPGGPSRASWDSKSDKDEEKRPSSDSQESVSDTASDIRIEEEDIMSNGLPGRGQGLRDKVDPATLEIEYRYFTFETPLPPHNTIPSSSLPAEPARSPPPPPDLKSFTDPHRWPDTRKNLMLGLSCVATFLTAYAAGSFSPPAARMAEAFHVSQLVALFSGITVFCLGFALTPMLLAPFSEFNGRYPVFVASGVVFVVFQIVSGASPNVAAILISRLLVGVGGSVFSTMVGGIIADMWHAEGRNTPMALFSGFVLLGTGCGPLICSVITYRTTYPHNPNDVPTDPSPRAPFRWVFWHQAIADGVLMLFLVFLFKESRGSVLLSRKAKALNTWYEKLENSGYYGVWLSDENGEANQVTEGSGNEKEKAEQQTPRIDEKKIDNAANHPPVGLLDPSPISSESASESRLRRIRWLVKDDEDRTTILHLIAVSVYRPFHMFFTEPVVFFFSLWVAFAWAVLYLTFGSIFLVFEDVYGWNMEQAGRAFSPMLIGSVLSTAVGIYQDQVLYAVLPRRLHARLRSDVPEARLYVACLTSVLLPVGLFVFGFTARPDVHWSAPMVGVGLATMGIYAVYLSTFNYLADVYHRFASSALAAQSCCRNVLGGIFPIVMRALFVNLGNARAGALLGSIATGLTFVPWVLVFFGERIRRRSKFAMSLEHS